MAKKIRPQCDGGILNDAIDSKTVSFIEHYLSDYKKFEQEFSYLLGHYRLIREIKNTEPMPKETIFHIEKMINQIKTLRENIDLLPLDAQAWCDEAIYILSKPHPYFESLYQHNLDCLLGHYSAVLSYSQRKIESYSNIKGRHKNYELHHFVYDTYCCLERHLVSPIQKFTLYELISKLLIQNGIHVPTEPENIGKIIRNIKKVKNDTSKV